MKAIFFSMLLFVALGCSSDDDAPFEPQTITPVLIGKGCLYYNFYTKQNIVITNNADWQTLLSNFNSVNEGISATFSETNIDFNNYELIVAIDFNNSSTTIDITNIVENADNITVTVENLLLGISGDVANPFHIVKISKSNKPVVFL